MDDPTAKPTTVPIAELADGMDDQLLVNAPSPPASPPLSALRRDQREQMNIRAGSLRQHAARGTLINTVFMIGLVLLGFVRGFILAAFLTRADYGLFSLLVVTLGTVLALKQLGIGDKFIQQDDEDQERAFQRAWTLEFASTMIFIALLAGLLPLIASAYGEPDLLLPGYVTILLVLPSGLLKSPLWVAYRRMEFLKQRTLQAIDPCVAFVVCIVLAMSGAGYWSMILGVLAGGWCSGIAVLLTSPYKLRFRYDKGTLRDYWSFSWPLFVGNGATLLLAQTAVFATQAHLGLAAVGAVALAASIAQFAHRLDALVSGALYPAICAVRDRAELLYETFVKSNRLALMWATPFGVGLALFCSDLVTFGIGEEWRQSVQLMQVYGLTVAVGHIAFNWDLYFRCRGVTKPMAVAAVASVVTFLAVGLPLLFLYDLRGLAIGIAAQALVHLCFRAYYLQRLFPGFRFIRHAARAIAPVIPAACSVLLLRAIEPFGERTLAIAMGELTIYVLVAAAATWLLERPLLREMRGYVFVRRPATA